MQQVMRNYLWNKLFLLVYVCVCVVNDCFFADEGGEKCKTATSRLKTDEDLQKMLKNLGEILFPKPVSEILEN